MRARELECLRARLTAQRRESSTRGGGDDDPVLARRLRHLVGEVRDRDAVGPAGCDARLDRGTDVVDVHVDVPEPFAADYDKRVAEREQGLAQIGDAVVVGLEEIHDFVRRTTLGKVVATDDGDGDVAVDAWRDATGEGLTRSVEHDDEGASAGI